MLSQSGRRTSRGRLDHLPLAGNDLQRLGDVLAQLRQPCAAAAGAGRRPGNDHPLARQMLGERLARRALAGEGRHAVVLAAAISAASSSSVAEASSSSSCSSSWSSSRALRSERWPKRSRLSFSICSLRWAIKSLRCARGLPLRGCAASAPAPPRAPAAAASGSSASSGRQIDRRHRHATEEHKCGGLW